jgi:hypothetical protein
MTPTSCGAERNRTSSGRPPSDQAVGPKLVEFLIWCSRRLPSISDVARQLRRCLDRTARGPLFVLACCGRFGWVQCGFDLEAERAQLRQPQLDTRISVNRPGRPGRHPKTTAIGGGRPESLPLVD